VSSHSTPLLLSVSACAPALCPGLRSFRIALRILYRGTYWCRCGSSGTCLVACTGYCQLCEAAPLCMPGGHESPGAHWTLSPSVVWLLACFCLLHCRLARRITVAAEIKYGRPIPRALRLCGFRPRVCSRVPPPPPSSAISPASASPGSVSLYV